MERRRDRAGEGEGLRAHEPSGPAVLAGTGFTADHADFFLPIYPCPLVRRGARKAVLPEDPAIRFWPAKQGNVYRM